MLPLQATAQQYSEQSLKTLFTTPQQRQAIDSDRRNSRASGNQIQDGPSSIQLNGIVKRSNGKSVVWINGRNTMDSTNVEGYKVYSNAINAGNKTPVMVDGKKIYLKPGETWSEGAGVSDAAD
ncbi:MAG: hypothetical protein RQ936_05875 [Gammaproteobacteria bacterium]|nr:hypothetical protein [Gammaproteobacteria bacterium]